MKKIIFTTFALVVLYFSYTRSSNAQEFLLGASDNQGDAFVGPDVKELNYQMSILEDSIWFQVIAYEQWDTFATYFFIDSDLNPDNGYDPTDVAIFQNHPDPNTSMRFDNRLLFAAKAGNLEVSFVESWGAGGGSSVADAWFEANGDTLLIGTSLSALDAFANDGQMNVLFVSGSDFFGQFGDYVPNQNFVQIGQINGLGESASTRRSIKVFPNLVYKGSFHVKSNPDIPTSITSLSLLDATGNEVLNQQVLASEVEVNVNHLRPGTYFLRVRTTKEIAVEKIVLY